MYKPCRNNLGDCNPIPAAPTATNNGPLCVGDNLTLSANTISGATYSWNGPNGFTSSSQNPTIAGISTVEAGTYSVSVSVSGCQGAEGTTTLIVAPPPTTPTPAGNTPVCSGTDLSLTANTISGATYNWSGPNSFTSSAQNPTITAVTTAADGMYSVFVQIGSCTSPAGTVSVSVNQSPAAPGANSNTPVCVGNDLSLTASTVGSSTYIWNGPNSYSSGSQNPVITGVSTAEAGTYSVIATENGCNSPVTTTTVIINPPPSAPTAGSNSPVCSGQTLSLTSNTIVSATYSWTGPNSFASPSQNPTIAGATVAADGTYSVTATVPGCPVSPAGTVSVTVNPTPAAPVASSNSPICAGNDLSLTASTVGSATYSWTGPNSYSSGIQDPAIVAATTANSGTYSVTATENGCTGPAGTTSVTVNPIPVSPTATNNGPLCIGDNLTLSANTISGATYSWSGPNGFTSTSQNPTISSVSTDEAGTYSVSVSVSGCQGSEGTTTLIVAPPPSAPTPSSNSPVCSGTDLSLTANTISGATYNWSGPNSFTSSSEDPTIAAVTTAGDGTYSVFVQIGSCTSAAGTVSVTVNQSPAAPTVSSNSPLCAGDNLTLTASTVAGTTYNWNGPNSFTSTDQNPIINGVTTAYAGTYSVIAIDGVNGCGSAVATATVSVTFPATVNAGADQTVCANNAAQLSGVITGGSGTGIWTTPNGAGNFAPVTTALNATYTPNINDTLAGDILLILTSTNNGGCLAAKDTAIVHVNRGPIVNAGADQSICSNNYATVAISGTIQFATGGDWSTLGTGTFVTTSTILTNTYVPSSTDSLNGSVILILSSTGNGVCSAVNDSILITFTPAPLVNAGTDIPVCFGNITALLNGTVSGGATTGTWTTLGTGTFTPTATTLNASYIMSTADTAAGSIKLVLTSTNFGNCVAETDTVMVYMTPAPTVAAGSDVTLCANNDTVALSGIISGGTTTGYWATSGTGIFLPDSSVLNANYVPSAADTLAGAVTLTLTSTFGCSVVKDSLTVTITDAPSVNAGPDVTLCGGTPVALNGFVNSAASGGGWTTSGNGTFSPDSSTLNASYIPGSNDTNIVTIVLTSTGNGQCLAVTDTMKITINKKPVAGFSNSQICAGQLITFTDTSFTTVVNDSIVSWNWTIAGANDTLQNPTHTYTVAGTDTVMLVVTNTAGCTDTVVQVVNIHPSPVAAFTYTVNCVVDSVYFTNTSTIPSGNIISWNWNFGDGNVSASQNPVHSYSTAGTYPVILTVTSDSGCTSVFTANVQTCTSVIAGFSSVSVICSGQLVAFTDTSIIVANDSIATWSWNFGDGGTDTVQNPSHAYASAGTFTVSLVVVTNSGASDSVTHVILVNPSPVASYTFLSTCKLDSVYFSDASTISAGGTIASWHWNFGDGDTSNVQSPVHYYDSTGAYVVSLTVTSDSGCTSTFTDTVMYAKDILAGFSHTADCQFNVSFTDTSFTASGDSTVAWSWNFGDGGTDTVQNPTHTYTASGTYTVQLIVTSSGGCSDTVTTAVTLIPLPVADFIPAGGTYYKGETINFTDLSANAATWMWSFGDSYTDSVQNPSHIYTQTGNLTCQLVVMNSSGCPDTVEYSFIIYPNTVGVPTAFTPNGDGLNDVLHVMGGPMMEMDWRIYNEWGNEVFHATDQGMGWDATYKEKIQPSTRYVYTLKGITISGDIIDISGEVTIVR